MSKKILHLIDSVGLGGAQTVVKGIFEKQKDNSNIFLYILRKREINIKIEHCNIITHKSTNKFSFPIIQLIKFIKQNDINVLHCHLAKSQIIGGILKVFFFPSIKLIFHEHGEIFEEGKIYPLLMELFKNKVDIYIAVSQATKRKILEKTSFQDQKIKVLYNFVDENNFKRIAHFNRKLEREKYELDMDDFVVGFAARLIKRKGWEVFLDSAFEISSQYQDIKFIIAGGGPDEIKIKNIIKHNRSIKYIGYVDDMVSFYNNLDVFVFSSVWEPMGLTGIEANACQTPVVASNIEGLNEIMVHGKNTLLFEKQNKQDLSEKIMQIYQDKNIRDLLIKNGSQEVKKYSLKEYLIDLNTIYER